MFEDKNPEQVLNELNDALDIFKNYGVMHQTRKDKIYELMNFVYEEEAEKNNPDNENYFDMLSIFELFDIVQNKEAFIKDFISTIQVVSDSSFHLDPDPVETIIGLRSSQE
jgi:hypothetical protein